jgi:hypothetical protein
MTAALTFKRSAVDSVSSGWSTIGLRRASTPKRRMSKMFRELILVALHRSTIDLLKGVIYDSKKYPEGMDLESVILEWW